MNNLDAINMNLMKAIKIKNNIGKFSTGGHYPNFTSRGKVWGSKQAVKLHLRQFCDTYKRTPEGYINKWQNNIPEEWIVVELSEAGIIEYSAKELYPKTEE